VLSAQYPNTSTAKFLALRGLNREDLAPLTSKNIIWWHTEI